MRHALPLFALALASGAGLSCVALGLRAADYHPEIDPANFQATVDNPYFPLVPGTVAHYVEKDGGETAERELTVTSETRLILGVTCVVVRDAVTKKGVLEEDSYAWFAQDQQGAVWSFGEDTKEIFPDGAVSTLGSWQAGVDGAQPGIVMPGRPEPGEPFRQEYLLGVAEDMAQVVALARSVTVPAATFSGCVETKEWSLLDSDSESKWFAKGVGMVRSESLSGGVETLVSLTRP